MARPTRRPAVRKHPASQPARLDQAQAVVAGQPEATADPSADLQAGLAQLLQDFESALRDEPSVDNETRELIRQQFDVALRDAAANPAPEVPDPSMWMDALESLRRNGEVADADFDGAVRRLNEALQPLERRESRLAIELSRRMQTDGEEKAIEWFRKEARKSTEDSRQSSPPPLAEAAPALRSEVVNSRSRRLRAPPK